MTDELKKRADEAWERLLAGYSRVAGERLRKAVEASIDVATDKVTCDTAEYLRSVLWASPRRRETSNSEIDAANEGCAKATHVWSAEILTGDSSGWAFLKKRSVLVACMKKRHATEIAEAMNHASTPRNREVFRKRKIRTRSP
jgi:hypothetical protein